MQLQPLLDADDHTYVIFCRGCDAGRSRKGATRDLDSQGSIDIYCRICTRKLQPAQAEGN